MLCKESSNFVRLKEAVVSRSISKNWSAAVNEWEIIDCEEDKLLQQSCVCGKDRLYYLFTIQNIHNGKVVTPIGSSCIKKFKRDELYNEAKIQEQMFKLLHAVQDNKFLQLDATLFSRKLLAELYKCGAFNNSYNNFNGSMDYNFMLSMFNKRDKNSITTKQQSKITAVLLNSIKPYLRKTYGHKVR